MLVACLLRLCKHSCKLLFWHFVSILEVAYTEKAGVEEVSTLTALVAAAPVCAPILRPTLLLLLPLSSLPRLTLPLFPPLTPLPWCVEKG